MAKNALHGVSACSASRLVEALGKRSFSQVFYDFVIDQFGADVCSIYQHGEDRLMHLECIGVGDSPIAREQISHYAAQQGWREDVTLREARRRRSGDRPGFARSPTISIASRELRSIYEPHHICDRVIIVGTSGDKTYSINFLRSDTSGSFTNRQSRRILDQSPLLISLISKHAESYWLSRRLDHLMTSLENIEAVVSLSFEKMTHREAQVCSRIIYGLSTTGIGLDLGISEESVSTYRKRAYGKLNISTQRELIIWYLSSLSHGSEPAPLDKFELCWSCRDG